LLAGVQTKPKLHLPGRPAGIASGKIASGDGRGTYQRRKSPRAPGTGGMHRPVYRISRIKPFEPFGHTQFRRYALAAWFSFSAFFVQMLLRGWLVNDLTDSPFLVSLVPVLYIGPMLIFTLVGGELADRFPRTRIVAIGESVVFLTYVILVALMVMDVVTAWHVLGLTGIHGITSSISAPARQTLVGDLVRTRLQRPALGLSPAIFNMAQIAGPLVGGLVLAKYGAPAASILSAALILPAIPLYARLKPVAKSPMAHHGNVIENLREGARYIVGHTTLRWYLVAGFVLVITVNTWGAMFPPLAKDVLGRGPGGLAALQVAVGIGSMVGAVFAVSLAEQFGERRLSLISGFLFAALVAALAVSNIFYVSVAIAGMAAAVATLYFVTNMITMQMAAAPEFRSRVISVRFIMFGFGPFGMIVIGALAQFLGTQVALATAAGSGAILLLIASLLMRTREYSEDVDGTDQPLGRSDSIRTAPRVPSDSSQPDSTDSREVTNESTDRPSA
jgi:MFS family permease